VMSESSLIITKEPTFFNHRGEEAFT